MRDKLYKLLTIAFLMLIGFGIHSLLGLLPKYSDSSMAIASLVYYLTLGATFIALFFGLPSIDKD